MRIKLLKNPLRLRMGRKGMFRIAVPSFGYNHPFAKSRQAAAKGVSKEELSDLFRQELESSRRSANRGRKALSEKRPRRSGSRDQAAMEMLRNALNPDMPVRRADWRGTAARHSRAYAG